VFGYVGSGGRVPGATVQRYTDSLLPPGARSDATGACYGWGRWAASANGITAFLDGRPFLAGNAAPTWIDAAALIALYVGRGRDCLTQLNGSFAIALWDSRTGELTLAVDRMGIAPLAWATEADQVVFSSNAADLAYRPNARSELRPQAIYDYFFFHMVPSPDTIFAGVKKLAPGTAIVFSHNSHREMRYWTPDFSRAHTRSFEELKNSAHAALGLAVQAQYAGATTGAFLSGGLDSSTVTGFLSRVSDGPAQTFSMGFGVESFDELEYARATNRHFKCNAHEYTVTPEDILAAIPVVARSFDEPFGNSSAVPTYACAKFARQSGMTRLLAGDGGDEIFAGNERYARHQVFEFFNRIPATLRSPLKAIVQGTLGTENPISVLRKFRSYVDQASIPLPERYESWNFVYREGAQAMFQDDFMGSVDPGHPMRHMREVFESTPSKDLLDRMLFYDWKFTLADNDLRKVSVTCNAAQIEVEFPMLDNRVVELSTLVPSHLKMNRLELRTFFKRAMTGFLPQAVLEKRKHGFGLPFGQWLKTHAPLGEMIYASLSDLKKRAIIRASFIDQLIESHRAGNPGYYGYVIWDLVILEEWLKHQAARTGSR
jgi:asparagine synthase (glutamine-hydrolysing)